ncbi:DKNYY domain-containing protein [Flavobacterium gelatinilyticum]|uniref:DKNYY domain-containing protein n=1 Tax=Flavobacterium gelatinilyticum TaxID=3003260 RepID=UPI002480C5DB|nr:DKNYY domain-containing protein [Flavobacterium gelatinilyticum]
MKKKLFILFSFIIITGCKNPESEPAIVDSALKTMSRYDGGNFLKAPVYIINKDYVIYQDQYTHNVIHPDLASFRIEKKQYSGFAFDKNGVYMSGQFIKTDTTGFVELGTNKDKDLLWKTKDKVFRNTTELKDIDAATFQLNRYQPFNYREDVKYFKDKNFIYYFDKKIEGSDGSSANTSSNDFCHDKKYIYSLGEIAVYGKEPIQYVNFHFAKTEKQVFSKGNVVHDLNPDFLTALSGNYALYKNQIYYGTQKTSIKVKDVNKIKVWHNGDEDDYITNGTDIFYHGIKLEGKYDLASFGFFAHTLFFYDKNGIYEQKEVKGKKDVINKIPFDYTEKVSTANAFANRYEELVFYKNEAYSSRTEDMYDDLSPKQLEIAKTQKKCLGAIDGSNTVIIDNAFSNREGRIYLADKRTRFDASTFTTLEIYRYYKDKNVVFYVDDYEGIQKMYDVDVNSAMTFNGFLTDKNYLYYRNKRIIKSSGIELLAVFEGYRKGCGIDSNPVSDFYLFKNTEGFWLVKTSKDISYRFLGKVFDRTWDLSFETIDLPEKYGNPRTTKLQKPAAVQEKISDNEVYRTEDLNIRPDFPGGINKFYQFLKKNYVIPKILIDDDEASLRGVFASFIIEKDGSLSDIKIVRDFGYGTGKELERVLKTSPAWIPAVRDGKRVRCLYSVPYYVSR